MSKPIAPLISVALELILGLIRTAQEAKELSGKEFKDIKARIDKEFDEIPTWEQLN
jgi:hypothetical protein